MKHYAHFPKLLMVYFYVKNTKYTLIKIFYFIQLLILRHFSHVLFWKCSDNWMRAVDTCLPRQKHYGLWSLIIHILKICTWCCGIRNQAIFFSHFSHILPQTTILSTWSSSPPLPFRTKKEKKRKKNRTPRDINPRRHSKLQED